MAGGLQEKKQRWRKGQVSWLLAALALAGGVFFSVFFFRPPVAEAKSGAPGYVRPVFGDLLRTYIGLGGIDLNNNSALDEYARVVYCPLYSQHFTNDFEWNKIRASIRDGFINKTETFHRHYEYVTPVEILRYDFSKKHFPITEEFVMKNVAKFEIFRERLDREGYCLGSTYMENFPSVFSAALINPLYIDGIKTNEKQGQAILKHLKTMGLKGNRGAYMRIRLVIKGIEGLVIDDQSNDRAIRLTAEVAAVDFYADEALTTKIASHSLENGIAAP